MHKDNVDLIHILSNIFMYVIIKYITEEPIVGKQAFPGLMVADSLAIG
jgi:hypothetical protein